MESIFEISTRTIQVETSTLPLFVKLFDKFTKLANKMKLEAPSYTLGTPYMAKKIYATKEECKFAIWGLNEIGTSYMVEITPVTLTIGNTFKFSGWSLLAIVYYTDGCTNLIDIEHAIPEHFGIDYMTCDHCNSTRHNRVQSFVVFNAETNEYKQVGSTCVKQFLGLAPNAILNLQACLFNILKGQDGEGAEDEGYTSSKRNDTSWRLDRVAVAIEPIFAAAELVLNTDKQYIKKEYELETVRTYRGEYTQIARDSFGHKIRSNFGAATVDKIEEMMHERTVAPSMEATRYAGLIEFLTNLEIPTVVDSDIKDIESFNYKIAQLATSTMIRIKDFWQVACAVNAYNKYLAEQERIKNNSSLSHIGTVGAKSEIHATITDIKTGFSADGGFFGNGSSWILYTMINEDGNKISKYGDISTHLLTKAEGNTNTEAQIGDIVNAMATVKKHKEYFNAPFTQVGSLSMIKGKKAKKAKALKTESVNTEVNSIDTDKEAAKKAKRKANRLARKAKKALEVK